MALSLVVTPSAITSSSVTLTAVPSGNTGGVSYFWLKSYVNEFAPESGNYVSTANPFTDNNVVPDSPVWYQLVAQDSGGSIAFAGPLQVNTLVNASPSVNVGGVSPPNASDEGVRLNPDGTFSRF